MMMVFKKLLEIQVESAQKLSRSFRLPFLKEYHLETEYRLFPPVTKFLDLFPRAGYFFNASD